MELKNVIHLYLGCRLESNSGFVLLMAVQKEIVPISDFKIAVVNGNQTYLTDLGDYKPILRPLSDMSEEELLMADKICNEDDSVSPMMAKLPFYLLSKHFDLFNLISTGQAISKTLNS